MTVAIIDARERQYVVLAQGAEIVAPLAQQTIEAAARAELAEIGAIAANGGFYADTAAGLAATTNGEFFAVPGDGTNTYAVLYRNDSGTATEIAEYQSKTAFDVALASKVDNTALLSLGDPIIVSAATELDASALNASVEITAASSFTVNLPVATETTAIKIAVSRGSVGRVTIQAASGSGANVDGASLIYMFSGESATFVWRGAAGWAVFDAVRVPIAAKLVTDGTPVDLPVGSFSSFAWVGGSQLMRANLQSLWLAGGYFTAPRRGVYQFSFHLWLNLTGAPGEVDVGFYYAPATGGSPLQEDFDRQLISGASNNKATYSGLVSLNEGDKIIPIVRPLAPITDAELGSLPSLLTVHEVFA